MAYKGLMRPVLEYASPVWDSHEIVIKEELEKARIVQLGLLLVTRFETRSITSILEQLGGEVSS